MTERIREGVKGEVDAKVYLEGKGYEIIDTNVRFFGVGEIDIVAMDKETLVIVEVKARKDDCYGHPFEAVGYAKRKKTVAAAGAYLAEHPTLRYRDIRFDVIGIIGEKLEHIEDAFYGKWLK